MDTPLTDKQYLLQKYPGKGGWTYALIEDAQPSQKNPYGWVKVKGSIDQYTFKNYKLMPLGKGRLFLPVKADIRKKINKKEGDRVHIILYEDNDPLEIPEELELCLRDDPEAHAIFMSYTEGEQKAYIDWIYSAKRTETRVTRITKTLEKLARREKFYEQK